MRSASTIFGGQDRAPFAGSSLILATGVFFFATPTMLFVARESWSMEQGAHGPIIMFTGLWLAWQQRAEVLSKAKQPPLWQPLVLLAVLLPAYVFSRITQIVEVEGYVMYSALLAALFSIVGREAMRPLWFPLLYLAFMFPPPETIVAVFTLPLKMAISQSSVELLHAIGFPVAISGVRIFIGQYELLVEAACSGLNSIISLISLSLFYIYVRHKDDWGQAMILVLFVIPIAVASNFVRVIVLILITYYAGEAAGQGFMHDVSGMLIFVVALVMVVGTDVAISKLRNFRKRSQGVAHA